MTEIFLYVVHRSIRASWIILAVLVVRLLLKKAPKWITVLLWGMVAFRLLCPFSIPGFWSLVPDSPVVAEQGWFASGSTAQAGMPLTGRQTDLPSGVPSLGMPVVADQGFHMMEILSVIWLMGVLILIGYTAISYWRLTRKMCTAVLLRENILQSEQVQSPFVLGLLQPRIYVPFGMENRALAHVIAHEQAHICRRDHWWKLLGFLLLAVYWFHPLLWLCYALLCRDMELACDEKVIRTLSWQERADYSQALLMCSVAQRVQGACPLCFGEIGVKERVKNVLHYQKPTFWVLVVAVLACTAVAVCFLTDPGKRLNADLQVFLDKQISEHHWSPQSGQHFCCLDYEVLGSEEWGEQTTVYLWVLYQEYSNQDGLQVVCGSHIPTAITAARSGGGYVLVEYWEPRDGSYYAQDVKEKFPLLLQGKALNPQRYIQKQKAACDQKAEAYFAQTPETGSAVGATVPISFALAEERNVPDAVVGFAQDYVYAAIANYERRWPEICDPTDPPHITQGKIVGLREMNTGTAALNSGIQLWRLEYRLQVQGNIHSILVGGMNEANGWLTESTSVGRPYLVVFWQEDEQGTQYQLCGVVTDDDLAQHNGPDMLEKYGNPYTAVAVETCEAWRNQKRSAETTDHILS